LARRAFPLFGAALFAISAVSTPVLAHGDLHLQIINMDEKIAAEPKSAALYLRRAELHRIHREWDAADLDYAKVLALEPKHAEVSWLRARAWLGCRRCFAIMSAPSGRVEIRDGQFEQLPLADASVDYLYSLWAMHWVSDARRAAAELRRVMKPESELEESRSGGDSLVWRTIRNGASSLRCCLATVALWR